MKTDTPNTNKRYMKFLLGLSVLLCITFGINWFLTYRLESFLNEKISENIAQGTDGFYHFSFEKLSVGLFDGELSIKGLEIKQDSTTYKQWLAVGSLPNIHFEGKIKEVELKGINLTWTFNYKKLEFSSFDVKTPELKIFNEGANIQKNEDGKIKLKDLYELVSPFFDVIEVRKMNLENASISYSVNDDISPTVYALNDINFSVQGFLLDKYSKERGKPLYSDNFDFWVEHPQTILNSQYMSMSTDTIRVNTMDSVIQIKGAKLHISKKLREYGGDTISDEYITAKLKEIELKRISFSQDGIYSHLKADALTINSADIQYNKLQDGRIEKEISDRSSNEKKTMDNAILYKYISPIFASISIEDIFLNEGKFQYIQNEDVYSLNTLNAHARFFHIDSTSSQRKDSLYWYSDSFSMDATDIEAYLPDRNHTLNIEEINLNSDDKYLRINKIDISPISPIDTKDYLSAKIDNITLKPFEINKGIDIGDFNIENAHIHYSGFANRNEEKKADNTLDLKKFDSNVLDIFSPFVNYLTIKRLNLSNLDFRLDERLSKNVYSIQQANLYITDFLVDNETRRNSPYLFRLKDFGIQFNNYVNILPDDKYKLEISKGSLSHLDKTLKLENIKLTPTRHNNEKQTFVSFESPLFEVIGDKYNIADKEVDIEMLRITDPTVYITSTRGKTSPEANIPISIQFPSFIRTLKIKNIVVSNADVKYKEKTKQSPLEIKLDNLSINQLLIDDTKGIKANRIEISNARNNTERMSIISEKLNINELSISELPDAKVNVWNIETNQLNVDIKNEGIQLTVEKVELDNWDWEAKFSKSYKLNRLYIQKPIINYNNTSSKKGEANKVYVEEDIYSIIGKYANQIDIYDVAIEDILVNYKSTKESSIPSKIFFKNFDLGGVKFDKHNQHFGLADATFTIKNLSFPSMKGYYEVDVESIDFSKNRNQLNLAGIKLTSKYPKYEFAYKHPTTHDWFNLRVDSIRLAGMDYSKCLENKELYAENLYVSNVLLENMKNQKVEIEHNKMPLIYEELRKFPSKFRIATTHISNFNVVYEELPKIGDVVGKIFFTEMNGKIEGLTNIVDSHEQFIRLDADGKLMGTGYFTATWLMPVDPTNDLFKLNAHVTNFNLTELNQLISPMAPAEIKAGRLVDLTFQTDATSLGANVSMTFLYNDLKLAIYRDKENKAKHSLYTFATNLIIKDNNPDHENKSPRYAEATLVRDPYHSTFNYFWQILQPPLIESVGVTQGKQNFINKSATIFQKIKNFFSSGSEKKKESIKE